MTEQANGNANPNTVGMRTAALAEKRANDSVTNHMGRLTVENIKLRTIVQTQAERIKELQTMYDQQCEIVRSLTPDEAEAPATDDLTRPTVKRPPKHAPKHARRKGARP